MVFAGVSSLTAMYQAGVAAHRALAPLDLTIIGVYFLVVFGIGFYFSRKERTSEEYFLAGRDIGWFFIGASLFVPFYLRSNVFTMPQFLERRFNRQCAVYLAGISIIAYIFTKISVQLYAASVVLERVAGWSLWKTAVVLVIATGVYTIAGGLAAVIYTDTVQT